MENSCDTKLHLSFIDISKAYDSVNRSILWNRLRGLGIRGEFLSSLKSLYTDDCIDCTVNGVSTRPIYLRRGLRQGCALSPLLFALYISSVGSAICTSQVGVKLGTVCVSGLLFADDIVLISKTSLGLKSLLALVKKHFDNLKLTISVKKSKVISPDVDDWDLFDRADNVEMTLEQVAMYKYLGTWTYNSMYRTASEKQKLCVKTASKYKASCIFVSRLGPDIVDVVLCTWLNVAIPAILHGCDMIPFSNSKIIEIERLQSQVAKFALGVSMNTPNVCAQVELGMKTFRQQLYERQLKFYFRVLYLPETRWVHQALCEHLSGQWKSPYLKYISQIRSQLGIFSAPLHPRVWKKLSNDHFLSVTNSDVSRFSCLKPIPSFVRQTYVCESEWSTVISEFRYENEGLGNKAPRQGRHREPFCPVCPTRGVNSGFHLLFVCSSLSRLRCKTGITRFISLCLNNNLSLSEAYILYVNGDNSKKTPIDKHEYLARGKCMFDMRKLWLSKW